MIVYLLTCLVLGLARLVFRGDLAKDGELLVLRHENAVLRRHAGRVRYEPADRAWFAALARLVPRRRWPEVFPMTPATLLACHRRLAARTYGTSKRRKPGRRPASPGRRPPYRPPGEGESAVGTPTDPRRTHEARRDSFAGRATPELPIGHSRSRRAGSSISAPDSRTRGVVAQRDEAVRRGDPGHALSTAPDREKCTRRSGGYSGFRGGFA
jgi:hypothetical protein